MKTNNYYFVFVVLWLVFSLNSRNTVESSEKIEERNKATATAYLSNINGEVMWLKKRNYENNVKKQKKFAILYISYKLNAIYLQSENG